MESAGKVVFVLFSSSSLVLDSLPIYCEHDQDQDQDQEGKLARLEKASAYSLSRSRLAEPSTFQPEARIIDFSMVSMI
ncbi:MAG: hypothetical protein DMF06_12335 [Verrucomicrobia bacterium]|nr:MAG: hypothetical protein DMF06_12335 [Verrucomicrobiota bacterium]